MILVLDNYDSFTYNLVHLLYALDADVLVVRNRELAADEIMKLAPGAIVLSPGPGRPDRAGCMERLIELAAGKVPVFGICLGHQAIGEVFGAKVVPAHRIMHGKISQIHHDGRGSFAGLRDNFKAVRYHSLALEEATLPAVLTVSARSEDGEIMGVRHREYPIEGIQYHPESIMTVNGKQQLANFISFADEFNRQKRMASC